MCEEPFFDRIPWFLCSQLCKATTVPSCRDWVSICIGINDVWRQFDTPALTDIQVQPEEYQNNLEKMILAVKDDVKGIFILTPYYMEPNEQDAMRARMDEYVQICKMLADKYQCKLVKVCWGLCFASHKGV